jgi:hypothetical protein
MKIWRTSLVLLLWGAFATSIFGQDPQDANRDLLTPLLLNPSGFHIANLSVASSYFHETFPAIPVAGSTAGSPGSLSASTLSASATVGWAKVIEDCNVSVIYSPSYVREYQVSNSHSINQSLGISIFRKLNRKLTVAGSFQGFISDFSQLLFSPTAYSLLTASPATLEELLATTLTGQSGNPLLAQLLSAAQLSGSPQTAFIYGGRALSGAASVSLSYAQSTRSSFNFSMYAVRTQFTNVGGKGENVGPTTLIPRTTAAAGSLGWSYALTPRTTISVQASSNRSLSRWAEGYSTQVSGAISRTLTPHWFVTGGGGVAYSIPLHETFKTPTRPVPEFTGSVGYKFGAQTLLASYSQSIYDVYGLGASNTDSGSGGWTWSRPGSSMGFSGSAGYIRVTAPASPSITSWTARAGFTKALPARLSMAASYSYARYPEALLGQAGNFALDGLMVGLNWAPSQRR